MKLNHKQFLAWVAINARQALPLGTDSNEGKITLHTDTYGNDQQFELTIHEMSFYKDYRYLWE